MKFIIQDDVFTKIPGLRVAIFIVKKVKVNDDIKEKISNTYSEYWKMGAAAVSSYPNVQSHPQIAAWRTCYQSLGVSVKKYTSSVENLLKRTTKSPEPKPILPLVDFYNAISIRYILPFGAFDIDDLKNFSDGNFNSSSKDLFLRLTTDGDTFMALDESEPSPIPSGEVAYTIGSSIVTRHINWKQSKLGLVNENSTDLIFMSEILSSVPSSVVEEMMKDFSSKINEYFNVQSNWIMMDQRNTSVEL